MKTMMKHMVLFWINEKTCKQMTLYIFFSCGQTLLKIQSKERDVLGGGSLQRKG